MRSPIWAVAIWLAVCVACAAAPSPGNVSISAQDMRGAVWCVADYREGGEALWIWRDGDAAPQTKAADWPGSTGELVTAGRPPRVILGECLVWRDRDREIALGVGHDGRIWSWWESQADTDEDTNRGALRPIQRTRRLYAYRHDDLGNAEAAGEWTESWAVSAKERIYDPRAWKLIRLVWIGADAWALRAEMGQVKSQSGGGAILQHLPSGKAEVVSYPLPTFDVQAFRELNMEVDAWGRIWVWGRVDVWPRKEVRFLGTFVGGSFDFSSRLAGLPEGEITSLVIDSDKRGAMIAVKGKGLWQADFERMDATPRLSPSLQPDEVVVSWQSWPDGTEVLLARSGGHGAYWGTGWLRDSRGWRMLGSMPGALGRLHEPAANPVHGSRACWSRAGQTVVLTGAGDAWGLSLSEATMRKLDWRVGCVTTWSREAYWLNDGKLWMARPGSGLAAMMLLAPAALAEAMSREPSPIEYCEKAMRGPYGAIRLRRQIGPDRFVIRTWCDGRWTELERPQGVNGGLMVDSLGRAWEYGRLESPAAVLDGAGAAFRIERSLAKLLETEAASGREFILRPTESAGASHDTACPVVWRGSVLVWQSHRFHLWQGSAWTVLPDQPGGWPTEMGFDQNGRVRMRMQNQPVRIWDEAGGYWREADDSVGGGYSWQRSDLAPRAPQPVVPDWFLTEAKKRAREHSVPSCFQDASGDWWTGGLSGLLRGRSGRVWPAIRPEIPDPWKEGREHAGCVVRTLGDGVQIWSGDSVVLIPVAALAEPPGDGD